MQHTITNYTNTMSNSNSTGISWVWRNFIKLLPPTFKQADYPDLSDTVALVTGASSGVGLELTKLLISKNCHVILGVRDRGKTEAVILKLQKELGDNEGAPIGKVDIVIFDLNDLTTISDVPQQISRFTDRLDLIFHNAGVASPPNPVTKQNIDTNFGVNAVGTFLLQRKLDDLFLKESGSNFKRIVWVTSAMLFISPKNGGLNWDLVTGKKPFKSGTDSYTQSKVADIYMAQYWSHLHKDDIAQNPKIISVSVHPGVLQSDISRNARILEKVVPKLLGYPCVYGAYTEGFAGLSPELNSKDHQGAFVSAFGRIENLRADIVKGFTDGTSKKLWDFLDETTANY